MKIIAIYARKSLFTGKGDSIGAQVDTCKRFIEYKFCKVEYQINLFKDEGWSGKTTDRPEFNKLTKLIYDKKIDYVVSYKLDRLGRTARDLHNFLYELDKLSIIYLSATEPYDTTTSAGRFMISILAAMAQMERERLAERVKSGMIQLAKQGRWLGGQTPLGFDSIKEIYIDDLGKERQMIKLTPNKNEITIIKLIYHKYLELGSMSKVKKWCLENNFKGKNGGYISTTTLKQILTSPIYVKSSDKVLNHLENQHINVFGSANGNGILTFNKTKEIRNKRNKSEWIASIGKHKGIIKDTMWLTVQSKLKLQSQKQIKSSGRQGTSNCLLSGFIKCSKCGNNLMVKTGHKSVKNGTTYKYYVCSNKNNICGFKCSNKNIRTDKADHAIIKQIKLYNKQLLVKNLITQFNEIYSENSLNKLSILQKNIEEKQKCISNLIKKLPLIEDENITKSVFKELSNMKKELFSLQLEFKKEKSDKKNINKIEICSFLKSLENFDIDNFDINYKKTLLSYILESVYWNGDLCELVINLKGCTNKV